MAIFEKKAKKMDVDEIAAMIKTLTEADLEKLSVILNAEEEGAEAEEKATEIEDKTEEDEAKAEEEAQEETAESEAEVSEEENGETPPETTEEAEEQRDAQDTIDALTARLEAQDEVIANLTERIDNIVAQLDDKPFGTQGKAKEEADDTTSDDAVMKSYNRSYRK